MDTGNYRVTLPLTDDHSPVVLYSEQGVGAQFAPGYKAPATSTAPTTASEAAVDTGKAAPAAPAAPAAKPAATTPAAAAPVAGGVNYQQQGTIVVQHQGFLSAGAPYPQQQQYYQPQAPIIYQMPAAPAPATPAPTNQMRGSGNGPA